MADDEQFQNEWSRIRFRCRVCFWSGLTLIPVHLLLFPIGDTWLRGYLAALILFFWGVFIVANFMVISVKCPRCKENYFRWYLRNNVLFMPDCKNCGLRFYEGSSFKSFGNRFGFEMRVTILFFGATADIAGRRFSEVEVSSEKTANTVFDQLLAQYPRLAAHKLHFSVNQEFATGDEILRDGDELAIFTAVSGG